MIKTEVLLQELLVRASLLCLLRLAELLLLGLPLLPDRLQGPCHWSDKQQIKRSLSQNACGCLCVCLFFSKLYHVAYSCSVFFISTHTNTGLEPNRPQASKTPADVRVCNGQTSQIGHILNHILVSGRKNTGSLNSNQKANIRLQIVHGATP